ncbi:uncharacterized protein GGS25DRAFT_428572 [Hypoxylon fragiforme]|uniref:uncharacterized protein n=1 Tax=Hypoxylon fragiforme TaxID=63214 RepID=UPI0020C64978|nr:uncharacterized protein GGS25DRAFT_428572 [Hypoxylon fragiforme]KAI2605401.1 hypothetical protein GGS25DRAFT_428572 [Hypoxylon fragiforme]
MQLLRRLLARNGKLMDHHLLTHILLYPHTYANVRILVFYFFWSCCYFLSTFRISQNACSQFMKDSRGEENEEKGKEEKREREGLVSSRLRFFFFWKCQLKAMIPYLTYLLTTFALGAVTFD